jgi:formylglycine-generating enzyme required for sulfatase activity
MKPSAARAAGNRKARPGRPAPTAGRGRKAVLRVALLAALAGGAFLAAYGLTNLRTGGAPPGMVWIPGGEFTMGSDAPYASPAEGPAHRVRVDGFWMDETDVTNAQFRAFVGATGSPFTVVGVSLSYLPVASSALWQGAADAPRPGF